MIKKVYNFILKIPFMLFIIILTGLISWEILNLIGEYEKSEQLTERIELEHYGSLEDKYYAVHNKLIDYLNEILLYYKSNGLKHMSSYYDQISAEYGYRLFDLVIADSQYVFDSTEKELHVGESFQGNRLLAIGKYFEPVREIRLLDAMDLWYQKGSYVWEKLSVYDAVDDSMLDFLKSKKGQLTVRICARETGSEYYLRAINDVVKVEKKYVDDALEASISDAVEFLVLYGIVYVVLWIFEIIRIKKIIASNENRRGLEKINTESAIFGFILFAVCTVCGYIFYGEPLKYVDIYEIPVVLLGTIVGLMLVTSIAYGFLVIIIKKLFRGRFISDMLIVRMVKKIIITARETYGIENYSSTKDIERLFIKKVAMDILVTILMVIYIISFVIKVNRTGVMFTNISELMLLILAIMSYIFYIYKSIGEYKYIRTFNKVSKNIDYLYQGMYELVDRDDDREINTKLANLSIGFKTSLAKQIEAEKLQVELITNVSHDLKTPLTSIISYVDLLSKEDLPAVAADYVKILVDKSDRLKSMVSDVFDLAKASSGEEIELESLDGMILVNQVLSDMGDAIAESGREIKVKADVEVAPITGNGQKLYRVFQNVIGNALKYSMPGTRIFVNTYKDGNEFVFTIKNVSEYEIDFTEEEILSRFVRGDKSRNSEGNGLGLSIAKSFTEQCGGSFAVKLDDDMFKIIIRLK